MNNKAFLSILTVWLAGCAITTTPPMPEPHTPPPPLNQPNSSIPYPTVDTQSKINDLGLEISRLNHKIDQLQTRIRQLERLYNTHTQQRHKQATQVLNTSTPTIETTHNNTYHRAEQAYRAGNYKQVLALLSGSDYGGKNDNITRKSMFLSLQAHAQLSNCESVINIGKRFATLFRASTEAPEALYQVALCQQKMQQRDIAKNTLRKLIQTYPDSRAAQKALPKLR